MIRLAAIAVAALWVAVGCSSGEPPASPRKAASPSPTSTATERPSAQGPVGTVAPEDLPCPTVDEVTGLVDLDDPSLKANPEEKGFSCYYFADVGFAGLTAMLGGPDKFERLRRINTDFAEDIPEAMTVRSLDDLGDEAFVSHQINSVLGNSVTVFVRYGELIVSASTPPGESRPTVAVALTDLLRETLRATSLDDFG